MAIAGCKKNSSSVTCGELRALTEGDSSIAIPTAFTPNGDGQDDSFCPLFLPAYCSFSMAISSGSEQLFSTTNSQKWDGRYKGNYVQQGDYSYTIIITDDSTMVMDTVVGSVTAFPGNCVGSGYLKNCYFQEGLLQSNGLAYNASLVMEKACK